MGRVAVAAVETALEVPSEASGAATSDFLRVSTREDGIRFPRFTKRWIRNWSSTLNYNYIYVVFCLV